MNHLDNPTRIQDRITTSQMKVWEKQLRPYQKKDIARIQAARKRVRSILFSAWMGSGKTHTYVALILKALKEGRRVLILVHMQTLLEQTYRRLLQAGLRPEQVSVVRGKDARFRLSAPIQLASAQTMLRRTAKALGRIDEIYLDEGHHYVAKNGWGKILNRYPKASILAPTATPARGDGRPLVGTFELMVESVLPVDHAVDDGWLMAPEIWTREGWSPDVTKVKKTRGDYEQQALGKRMASINICGRLVEHWQEKAEERPTIGFAVNTALAAQYARRFCKAGIPSEVVLGDTSTGERQGIFERLANGDTKVVWTCNVVGEGWDAPYVRCIIDATPTMSIVRNLQRWGRVMRAGDVQPIILDHAGNWVRFGFPHTPREWELPRPAKGGVEIEGADRWVRPRTSKIAPSVRVDASGRVVQMTSAEVDSKLKEAIKKVKKKTGTKLIDAEIEALIEKQARRWSETIVGVLVDENELERLVLAMPLPCGICGGPSTQQSSISSRTYGSKSYCAKHVGGLARMVPREPCAVCGNPTESNVSRQAKYRGGKAYCAKHKKIPHPLTPCSICGDPSTQGSCKSARRKNGKTYCQKHHNGNRSKIILQPCNICRQPATKQSSSYAKRTGGRAFCAQHKGQRALPLLPCSVCHNPATKCSSEGARYTNKHNAYCKKHKWGKGV